MVLERKVHSAETRAAVGKNYEKLHLGFDNFQNILKTTYQQQKVYARPKKQVTIKDMFSKASTSR